MKTENPAIFCSSLFRRTSLKSFATKFFALIIAIGIYPELQASHDQGAYIHMECVNACTSRVVVRDLQDCSAVPGPGAFMANVYGSGGASCITPVALGAGTNISSTDLTPLYPQAIWSPCQVSGSPISAGFIEYRWEQLYDLCASACDDYYMDWSLCCRYTSSSTAGTPNMYFWTEVHASQAACNNTPVMNSLPPVFMSATDTMLFDLSATDADGDSLVYTLFDCYQDSNQTIVYNPGFSGTAPHGPSWGFTLDAHTGLLEVLPSANPAITLGPICYMIEEYRNGVKLSETHLDLPSFHAPGFDNNITPKITGISNLQNGVVIGDTLFTASLDSLSFDIEVVDPDTGIFQDLFLTQNSLSSALVSMDTSGAPMDTIRAKQPIGRYQKFGSVASGVYPMQAQTRDQLWISNWIARDTFDFVIKVVDSLPPVWPGDANNDLIANNIDVLTLGLAFGNTGPLRPNASNAWTAQPGAPWVGNIPSGPNMKFSDCDGNGVVNDDDTMAVFLNYGLIHNKGGGTKGTTTDPDLIIAIPPDSSLINDTIHAPIYLGTNAQPAVSVYGVAFSLRFDTSLVKNGSMHIDFNGSWMGGTSPLRMAKDLYDDGQFDAVHVRTDQMGVNGNGQIGTLHFIITDNIDGKTVTTETLRMMLTNVTLIDQNGIDLGVNAISDSVVVSDVLNAGTDPVASGIRIWPVPAYSHLNISSYIPILGVEVFNLQGQLLSLPKDGSGRNVRIGTASLPQGVYFIRIKTEQGTLIRRWLK